MPERYGVAEWYGVPLDGMSAAQRGEFSAAALRGRRGAPPCPFQEGAPSCQKSGGVCSLRRYEQGSDGRLGASVGEPVTVCPSRFEEGELLIRWLAEIVGFAPDEAMVAREAPFMACGRSSRVWETRALLRRSRTPSAARIGARPARSV